jgi:putative aminopeptidase FrvX
MSETLKESLRRLVTVPGPSGRESEVGRVIADLIRPFVDEVRTDALGNIIATRGAADSGVATAVAAPVASPASRSRLMLAAHMDTASLIVTEVTKDGFARFALVGVYGAASLPGQAVTTLAGTVGVVGLDDGVDPKDIGSGKMHIAFGAADREAAKKLGVFPGEAFCLTRDLIDLGDTVSSPALDNRAGCAVVIETARLLREADSAPAAIIDFVFTVQGAIAPRGARPAAFALRPSLALAVDVTAARGPGKPKTRVELGQGPTIRVMDGSYVAPVAVREQLARAAAEAGIAWQVEVSSSEDDVTDAAAVEIAGAGTLTGVVGLPARQARTAAAVVSLADLLAAARLLAKVAGAP